MAETSNLDNTRVTVRYDDKNRVIGYGYRNIKEKDTERRKEGAVTTVNSRPVFGEITVTGEKLQKFFEEGYKIQHLRVKKGRIICPISSAFKVKANRLLIDARNFTDNFEIWLKKVGLFLGHTVFGQTLLALIISFIFLAALKSFILSEQITISGWPDFLKFYLPLFTAFLFVALGTIGVNAAERRHRETRNREVAPIFFVEAIGPTEEDKDNKIRINSEQYQQTEVDLTEDNTSRTDFHIENKGNGIAFNTWIFVKKANGGFTMSNLRDLCPDEHINVIFQSVLGENVATQVFFVCNDLDNNLLVSKALISRSYPPGRTCSPKALTDSDFEYRSIKYALKSWGA